MHVKPTNPATAIGLIDPQTMRSPFIDPETKQLIESADVPDNVFWTRRLLAKEIALVESAAPAVAPAVETAPTGREPVTPLTTRSEG